MILNQSDFNQKVLDAEGIVFVEFFATWCPHCQAFGPEYEQISQELGNQAAFYQVEIDDSPGITDEFGVDQIPTIIVFDDGVQEAKFVGAQPEQVFEEVIQDLSN